MTEVSITVVAIEVRGSDSPWQPERHASPPGVGSVVEAYQQVKGQMKRNDDTPAFIEQREET